MRCFNLFRCGCTRQESDSTDDRRQHDHLNTEASLFANLSEHLETADRMPFTIINAVVLVSGSRATRFERESSQELEICRLGADHRRILQPQIPTSACKSLPNLASLLCVLSYSVHQCKHVTIWAPSLETRQLNGDACYQMPCVLGIRSRT